MRKMRKWLVLLVVLALVVASVGGCDEGEEEVVIADFTATPTYGIPPLEVQFIDESTGDITAWEWDFGDGSTSTERSPSHTYSAAGEYTVALTVTGPDASDTETKTDYIEVGELIADFTAAPIIGPYPLEVQFTDNSIGEVTGWEWDFDNDGTVDSTEQSPSHTYEIVGDYTISLTVTGPEGSDTETKASYVAVREPTEPEGTLTVAVTSLGTGRYPACWLLEGVQVRRYEAAMGDSLIYVKHDTHELIPGLAERWEVSSDRMSCTFWLREGVQFHDGWGELTAEDVKFTIEMAVSQDDLGLGIGKNAFVVPNLKPYFDRIEIAGPYEFTVYFNVSVAEEAPKLLSAFGGAQVCIVSKDYFDSVGVEQGLYKPVYSGPYKFVEEKLGEKLVLEAVEDHWRVVPEYKHLIFKTVPEEMTRVAMLKTGEADVAEVSSSKARDLGGEGFGITTIPSGMVMAFTLYGQWLPESPTYDASLPWLDKRVREAMNLAINREEVAEYLYHDYATPASLPFYVEEWDEYEPYGYDPDRAKELLTLAGYPDGFDLEVWIVSYVGQAPEIAEVSLAVAGYWQDIGLNPSIKQYSALEVWGKIMFRDTVGVSAGFANSYYPPWAKYSVHYDSRMNIAPHYESPVMDALLDEMRDTWETDRIGREMTQLLYDEYVEVPVVAGDITWAKTGDVGNWVTTEAEYLVYNWEYIEHSPPLDLFRLFEP